MSVESPPAPDTTQPPEAPAAGLNHDMLLAEDMARISKPVELAEALADAERDGDIERQNLITMAIYERIHTGIKATGEPDTAENYHKRFAPYSVIKDSINGTLDTAPKPDDKPDTNPDELASDEEWEAYGGTTIQGTGEIIGQKYRKVKKRPVAQPQQPKDTSDSKDTTPDDNKPTKRVAQRPTAPVQSRAAMVQSPRSRLKLAEAPEPEENSRKGLRGRLARLVLGEPPKDMDTPQRKQEKLREGFDNQITLGPLDVIARNVGIGTPARNQNSLAHSQDYALERANQKADAEYLEKLTNKNIRVAPSEVPATPDTDTVELTSSDESDTQTQPEDDEARQRREQQAQAETAAQEVTAQISSALELLHNDASALTPEQQQEMLALADRVRFDPGAEGDSRPMGYFVGDVRLQNAMQVRMFLDRVRGINSGAMLTEALETFSPNSAAMADAVRAERSRRLSESIMQRQQEALANDAPLTNEQKSEILRDKMQLEQQRRARDRAQPRRTPRTTI